MEYAYNNIVHSFTSKTSFKIIKGNPKIPLLLQTHESIFTTNIVPQAKPHSRLLKGILRFLSSCEHMKVYLSLQMNMCIMFDICSEYAFMTDAKKHKLRQGLVPIKKKAHRLQGR